MPKKIVSGSFKKDVFRLFGWMGHKAKGRLKGRGKGFWHRLFEAMNK
jgi:hypothetical protein